MKLIGDISLLALFLFFSAAISQLVLVQILKISSSQLLDYILVVLCVSTVFALGGSIALVARHLLKHRDALYPLETPIETRSNRTEG